ncbi:MAG: rhodanese-related sulfurtransferase [Gammaproteobacteria bacterium]|jgi:rhodanese-related sulfurtransferase
MAVSPANLRAMLVDGDEIALLDVREEGEFGTKHILLAVNVPMSVLELRTSNLVPRANTRIVLCDSDGGDLAVRGAARLQQFGYTDIDLLEGGTEAWEQAGFETFSGMNVPSKLFGEFIEHHYNTPSISAEELTRNIDAGEDLVVLDSRPRDEYNTMSIPGSTCIPGAELVFQIREVVANTNTLVVVNCAGRTRSIIGAQSLINADIGNQVVALRNGTMGWHLAGFELEHGQQRYVDKVGPLNGEEAQRHAAAVAKRFGVRTIDQQTLNLWQQSAQRSVFLLDVRSPEEYISGHVPASICAPGGQLVQATDRYVGTLRATLVLVDDNGVRAAMTASWLNQLGLHEVVVLERALFDSTLLRGRQRLNALGIENVVSAHIDAFELSQRMANSAVALIDLQRSLGFRKAHIDGAIHATRGRVAQRMGALPEHELLVLTARDDLLARYAFDEVSQLSDVPVQVLRGGNEAWEAQGFALVSGNDGLEEDPVDAFLRPYDRDKSIEDAMQSYLDWEIALMDKLDKDGTLAFKTA